MRHKILTPISILGMTILTISITDDYLKSSSKKWNNYIDAINKQLEQNNENIIN